MSKFDNSIGKVLRASEDDEGSRIFENVLDLSLTYKQKTQALLVKSAILKAGLVIKVRNMAACFQF